MKLFVIFYVILQLIENINCECRDIHRECLNPTEFTDEEIDKFKNYLQKQFNLTSHS